MMSVKTKRMDFKDFGPVLSTRERGREAADRVQDALRAGPLVLNFHGVEIATPSFLDEIVVRLAGLLMNNETLVVAITGMNPDVRDSMELILDKRGVALTLLSGDQIELLGGSEQVRQTLAAAQKLGRFSAKDLARELKVKLPSLHQRLNVLLDSGAITRKADPSAKRGRRYDFTAPSAEDLKPEALGRIAVG